MTISLKQSQLTSALTIEDIRRFNNSLVEAVNQIGGSNAVLIIPTDTTATTASNLTVPSNIVLKVEKGGTISVSAGIALTLNCFVDAGRYQIFTLASGATVSYSVNQFKEWDNTGIGEVLIDGYTEILDGYLLFRDVSDPTAAFPNAGFLYAKNDSGDTELFFMDDSGRTTQITKDGLLNADEFAAHSSSHISSGSDEIDGDKLDIDWNPTHYAPTTSPTEADSVDDLTAHLAGIDDYLISLGNEDEYQQGQLTDINTDLISHIDNTSNPHQTTAAQLNALQFSDIDDYAKKSLLDGYVELSQLDDYTQKSLLDGYVELSQLDDYAQKTLLDSYATTSHASTHITSGSDEIDGDQLDIDWAPTNYIPTTSPSEVSDADHLTAHLAGIDDYLGGLTGLVADTVSAGAVGVSTNTLNLREADLDTGLGTTGGVDFFDSGKELILLHRNRINEEDNIAIASVWDAGVSSPDTVKIHSFGFVDNTNTYQEAGYINASGDFFTTDTLRTGPTFNTVIGQNDQGLGFGVDNSFIQNSKTSGGISIFSRIADAAGNRNVNIVWKADGYTPDDDVKIMTSGWSDPSETYNENLYLDAYGSIYVKRSFNLGLTGTLLKIEGYSFTSSLPKQISISSKLTDRPLGLHSKQGNGDGYTSIASLADVGVALISNNHIIHSFGWIDNADVFNEVVEVRGSNLRMFDDTDLLWDDDGYGDIGGSSDNRPNNIYAATDISAGDDVLAFDSLFAANTNIQVGQGNQSTGLGSTAFLKMGDTSEPVSIISTRTSGSGNKSLVSVADVNAASIDSNHVVHDFGWTNNSDVFASLLSIQGGGDLIWGTDGQGSIGSDSNGRPEDIYISGDVFADGYLSSAGADHRFEFGDTGTGVPTTEGLAVRTLDNRPVILQSSRGSGSNNISCVSAADVNTASINDDHIIHSFGWVSSSDSFNQKVKIRGSGTIELLGTTANIIWSGDNLNDIGALGDNRPANVYVGTKIDLDGYLALREEGSDPGTLSNAGSVYTKEANSITELHFIDSGGTVLQMTSNGNPLLPSYTVSSVPSASPAGMMAYITDETGGAVPAFSDGTNWRRVTDRSVIS